MADVTHDKTITDDRTEADTDHFNSLFSAKLLMKTWLTQHMTRLPLMTGLMLTLTTQEPVLRQTVDENMTRLQYH